MSFAQGISLLYSVYNSLSNEVRHGSYEVILKSKQSVLFFFLQACYFGFVVTGDSVLRFQELVDTTISDPFVHSRSDVGCRRCPDENGHKSSQIRTTLITKNLTSANVISAGMAH